MTTPGRVFDNRHTVDGYAVSSGGELKSCPDTRSVVALATRRKVLAAVAAIGTRLSAGLPVRPPGPMLGTAILG